MKLLPALMSTLLLTGCMATHEEMQESMEKSAERSKARIESQYATALARHERMAAEFEAAQLAEAEQAEAERIAARQAAIKAFDYNPKGYEEFFYAPVEGILHGQSYRADCTTGPEKGEEDSYFICRDKLPTNYAGVRGYYTNDAPMGESRLGQVVRRAVLETGEVVYTEFQKDNPRASDYRLPIDAWDSVYNFQATPIVDGSEVMITGRSRTWPSQFTVSSQQRHGLSEKTIAWIRKISKRYPAHRVDIANALTMLTIEYDDFDGTTTVKSPAFVQRESFLSIDLTVSKSGKISHYLSAQYRGESWIFAEYVSVAADSERWSSPAMKFVQYNQGGTVWEWARTPLTDEHIEILSKAANAGETIIRFRGSRSIYDHSLSDAEQKVLASLVTLAKSTR